MQVTKNDSQVALGDKESLMSQMAAAQSRGRMVKDLSGATVFKPGAIVIDWFDPLIFDDVYRDQVAWNRIDKRLAPGDHTGGFNQTAIGNARSADRESLSYSATNPTRAARTTRDIKAIAKDITFGIFYQSVGRLATQPWGDLTDKDVADQKAACMRLWAELFYEGDVSSPLEFDGLRTLLASGAVIIDVAESIVRKLNHTIAQMIQNSDQGVRPTAIYTNAMVLEMITLELLKLGVQISPTMEIKSGSYAYQVMSLNTPAGVLPIIADPFNQGIAGTVISYPTFIVTERLLSWQYVPVLDRQSPDPQTYEIALTNALDRQYKTLMFGALELLGGTTHHKRVNINDRATVVSPAA